MASRILTMQSPLGTNKVVKNIVNVMESSTSSQSSSSSNPNDVPEQHIETSKPLHSFSGSNIGMLGSATKLNLGLMNAEGKYLTAENFGFKINVSGNTLRKKQKWQIEQEGDEFVYLISPLGCYLSTDKYGKVSCEKKAGDQECKFALEVNSEGKWAFKSVSYGYYFGGSGDKMHCFSKTPELWTVHLAIHPQVGSIENIRNKFF